MACPSGCHHSLRVIALSFPPTKTPFPATQQVRAAGCMALASYARLVPEPLLPQAVASLLACATCSDSPGGCGTFPSPTGFSDGVCSVRPLRLAGSATLLTLVNSNATMVGVMPRLLPSMLDGAIAAAGCDGVAVGCALLCGIVSAAGAALLSHGPALLEMLRTAFAAGAARYSAHDVERCTGVLAAIAEALGVARDEPDTGAHVPGTQAQRALRDSSRALLEALHQLVVPLAAASVAAAADLTNAAEIEAVMEAHRIGLGCSVVEISCILEYLYAPTACELDQGVETPLGVLPRSLLLTGGTGTCTPEGWRGGLADCSEPLALASASLAIARVLSAFGPMLHEAACDEAWEASDAAITFMIRHLGDASTASCVLFEPLPAPILDSASSHAAFSAAAARALHCPSAAQSLAASCGDALASGGPGASRRAGMHLLHVLSCVPSSAGGGMCPASFLTRPEFDALCIDAVALSAHEAIRRGARWPRSTSVAVLVLCRCVSLAGPAAIAPLVRAGGPNAPLVWLRALLLLLKHGLDSKPEGRLFPPEAIRLLVEGCDGALRIGLNSQVCARPMGRACWLQRRSRIPRPAHPPTPTPTPATTKAAHPHLSLPARAARRRRRRRWCRARRRAERARRPHDQLC